MLPKIFRKHHIALPKLSVVLFLFVIGTLTESNIPRNYWRVLKRKLRQEGSQLHENIMQLKIKSKKYGKNN